MLVLLIDDNEAEYVLLKEMLNRGVTLEVAFDSQEAEKLLIKKQFDLIVIDVNLTIENGYEVAEQLKHHGAHIVITSNSFGHTQTIRISQTKQTVSKEKLAEFINEREIQDGLFKRR